MRQQIEDRDVRAAAIVRADFSNTLAGHPVAFPASPRLGLVDACGLEFDVRFLGCRTGLTNPVTRLTNQDEALLHERSAPISFRSISISVVEPECGLGDFCLTQAHIDRWCREIRPDQADNIGCRDAPPIHFWLQTDKYSEAIRSPSHRDEPECKGQDAALPSIWRMGSKRFCQCNESSLHLARRTVGRTVGLSARLASFE